MLLSAGPISQSWGSRKTDHENYLEFCETEFSIAISVKFPHKSCRLKITIKGGKIWKYFQECWMTFLINSVGETFKHPYFKRGLIHPHPSKSIYLYIYWYINVENFVGGRWKKVNNALRGYKMGKKCLKTSK